MRFPLLRAMRPHQWVKNVLIAAAPIAAGALDDSEVILRTLGAIAIFALASSAIYLINDAADVEVDRLHPKKRSRPIAAGLVSVARARQVAGVLIAISIPAALLLAPPFALVIAAYIGVNLAYSGGLKHTAYLELGAVASGFFLRAIAGGVASDLRLSAWFMVVVCAGSLFVVVGKRSAELARTRGVGGRKVLARYSLRALRMIRGGCGVVAIVAYALWVVQTSKTIGWLALLSLLAFAAALARYSQVIDSGMGEDPEDIFRHDRPFQAAAIVWAVVYAAAVYG